MCGIVGIFEKDSRDLAAVVQKMADALRHRGPDDSGVWCDAESGVAFGQRRLAILDLSAHGHQPMLSADGRFVINYNGEIYNYLELGKALAQEGSTLQSRCDTEVVIEAVSRWGIERTLTMLNGMFAFSVFDRRERV